MYYNFSFESNKQPQYSNPTNKFWEKNGEKKCQQDIKIPHKNIFVWER